MDRICERCGTKLLLGSVNELDEGTEYRYYCPHCGMVIELYYCGDNDKNDTCVNLKGKVDDPCEHYCYNCGEKIKVSGNECLSDSYDIDPGSDNDKMCIDFHECDNCGCSQIIWDVSETEKQLFEYWKVPSLEYDVIREIVKNYNETMNINIDVNELPVYKLAFNKERVRCSSDFHYWLEKHCPFKIK